MSLLFELNSILDELSIPVETGFFSKTAPDEYVVLIPLVDTYELHVDDHPVHEIQEVRLSLFSKGNYITRKRQIETALLTSEITITDRRYIGYERDTGYHHYAIDVAKHYELEE